MKTTTMELNKELKEEIGKTLTDLLKEIGNNRQQLFNKVMGFHTELHRELSKNKIDDNRQKEIRIEVSRIIKMAHQQLPHLKFKVPQTTAAVATPRPEPKPKPEVKPKPEPKAKEEPKAKPAAKPKPAPKAKPVAKKKK
ncbi:MAG TPA: hypothetical protein PLR06_04405 [Cyclobacteriaceae bacterium]|nr:hypothetical protein [Cyclobacteriaceae bacterium]